MDAAEYAAASRFLGRLWSAVLPTYRLPEEGQEVVHIPAAFEVASLHGMPLPLAGQRSTEQTVALVDEAGFHREVANDAIVTAYQERPRTRVYEGMDVRSDGWYSVAAIQLARLARCRVVCSMYESDSGDRNLGAHEDEWLGEIVQMRGAKSWTLWPRAGGDPREVLTQAGDVLLLPRGIEHAVSTPDYSVHLVFAFVTGEPIR
ncbi:cupin domain-containing protein [Streptomyces sp. NPDC006733]|uniref:JmjC domain-containing protein n=1 Tax=Streptomyces sp. NPDC006733 TaxID=3155460 RepID=UPI0033CAFABD